MTVRYAESSAILAWLLGEPRQKTVLGLLSAADRVVSSILTVVECSRALAQARAASRVSKAEELAALRLLDEAAATWSLLDVSDRAAVRASGSFPVEPIRTLDALHLATALVFDEAIGNVEVLSLDDRIRHNAAALGLAVVPA